jgi:hypothetical protein
VDETPPDPTPHPPARVHNAGRARRAFPDLFDDLVLALERSDEPADRAIEALASLPADGAHRIISRALSGDDGGSDRGLNVVPEPLRAMISDAAEVPLWVDFERVDRAGRIFFRAGLLGGIALGMRSLIYGYAAPVGNKPLAFSGALERKAQRRLAETGKFVSSVCQVGQMHPGGEGYASTIQVRLMHAQVRRLTLSDPRWKRPLWGLPINQHDMLATVLLFSVVFLEGLRRLGVDVTRDEQEDYVHLWRWVGYTIGVEDGLLPRTLEDAERRAEFIFLTQGRPDQDSRALVRALLDDPLRQAHSERQRRRARKFVTAAEGICRMLVDDETARGLNLNPTFASWMVPGVRTTFELLGRVRRRVPRLDDWVHAVGSRYWAWNIARGLHQGGVVFPLPMALEGRSRAG